LTEHEKHDPMNSDCEICLDLNHRAISTISSLDLNHRAIPTISCGSEDHLHKRMKYLGHNTQNLTCDTFNDTYIKH